MSIHKMLKKSGVRYKAVVQISPTKQLCRVFGRKIDAEAWEDEQKVLQRKSPDATAKVAVTLSELSVYWIDNYACQHKAESSLIHDKGILKNQILPDFGPRIIGELNPRDVERWMNRLRLDQRLSPKSCNLSLGLLRKMLNDAVRWQFIPFNPISTVRPFRIDQQDFAFWTRDEAVRFMSHAQKFEVDVFPVFAVALYTGLRKGELRGLKWDCVNLDQRQITVKRSYCQKSKALKETTKSKKIRHVPINKPLFEVLVGLRNESKGAFVLPNFHYHHCYRVMQRLSKAANVKAIRFHDLRHTFASHFMMAG